MKNSVVLLISCLLFLASCSKSAMENNVSGTANVIDPSAVPVAVRTALNNNFSGATEIEWQRTGSNSFVSQFNHNNQRHEAGFDDNGHQTSHSIICIDAPVPGVVLDAFRQRFPTDNVYEWKLGNDGTWKAHFMRGTLKYEATYSATGTLLKFEQSS